MNVQTFYKDLQTDISNCELIVKHWGFLNKYINNNTDLELNSEMAGIEQEYVSFVYDLLENQQSIGNGNGADGVLKPSAIYREVAPALKLISSGKGELAGVARHLLMEIELGSTLPRWELERDVYLDSYTGEAPDEEDIDYRFTTYETPSPWQEYIMTRKPYGENEELNRQFIEANLEFIPHFDVETDEEEFEDDHDLREPVFVEMSRDHIISEEGFEFLGELTAIKQGVSAELNHQFRRYREKNISWTMMEKILAQEKHQFALDVFGLFRHRMDLDPMDLVAGWLTVEARYDLDSRILGSWAVVGGRIIFNPPTSYRHKFGVDIFPPMYPTGENISLLEFINRHAEEMAEALLHSRSGSGIRLLDINEAADRCFQEILSTYPEQADHITHSRLWNEGYMLAVMDGETETKNAAWDYWRENVSEVVNIAFHAELEESNDIRKAWAEFYNTARLMGDLTERITSIGPSGPMVAHQYSDKGMRISWQLCARKIQNNEIIINPEDTSRLKDILHSKGWGSAVLKVLA